MGPVMPNNNMELSNYIMLQTCYFLLSICSYLFPFLWFNVLGLFVFHICIIVPVISDCLVVERLRRTFTFGVHPETNVTNAANAVNAAN